MFYDILFDPEFSSQPLISILWRQKKAYWLTYGL